MIHSLTRKKWRKRQQRKRDHVQFVLEEGYKSNRNVYKSLVLVMSIGHARKCIDCLATTCKRVMVIMEVFMLF